MSNIFHHITNPGGESGKNMYSIQQFWIISEAMEWSLSEHKLYLYIRILYINFSESRQNLGNHTYFKL